MAKIEEMEDLAKKQPLLPKKATAAIPRGPSKQSPQHALHSHLLKLLTELRFNKKIEIVHTCTNESTVNTHSHIKNGNE